MSDKFSRSSWYRRQAENCLKEAQGMPDSPARIRMTELAQHWLRLAEAMLGASESPK